MTGMGDHEDDHEELASYFLMTPVTQIPIVR
jgi:hypothetical protein